MKKIGMIRMNNPFDPNPYPPGREPKEPPDWWNEEDYEDDD